MSNLDNFYINTQSLPNFIAKHLHLQMFCNNFAEEDLYKMDVTDKIRETGLKVTPQRKAVYEAMMELRHAPIETIISHLQSKGTHWPDSTVYRILDSFYKAGLLSQVYHPQTNQCYYDITVHSHHHVYDGTQIVDYEDPELTQLIRQYLEENNRISDTIDKIQVQIIVKGSLT